MNKQKIKFDNKKFKEAILYLILNSPNSTLRGKKKLAKLLYFADFNFFEAYEKHFTGATYRALPMGPVPDELDYVLKKIDGKEINISKRKIGLENDLWVFVLNKKSDELKFNSISAEEKLVLDKVCKDYSALNGNALEAISHAEAPFNAVTQGEKIPYELSFYRGKTLAELTNK